jgi:triosephosphate isomerase
MRKKILAANWKMNLLHDEAIQLISEFNHEVELTNSAIEVVVFSPSLYIHELSQQTNFKIGVQNFYFEKSGAFTGELSISQVKSCGANSLLIGHSERRQIFGESDELLKSKVNAAVESNMHFIFCCGEALETRDAEKHIEFVVNQLHASLFHLDEKQILSCAIAYEPIWAIGTGRTASTEQAEEMHAAIRESLSYVYGATVANEVSILYGGSCNSKNAAELFACPNVDGGLIGGASLQSETFNQIAQALL